MAAAEGSERRVVRMAKKKAIVERLLQEGFFSCKEKALPYVMSGAVLCGGVPVQKAGQLVPQEFPITVRGLHDRYVGKGGYKLEGAIADFGITVKERICIDAGACTGGFTDCFVQQGAALVYAVEVGFRQLAGSLAQHPHVVNLEKTNLSDEKLLTLMPLATLGSVDLSYLSLVRAVPQFRAIMRKQGELLCLVKPLFETEDSVARRTGEIAEAEYVPLLLRLIAELNQQPETHVHGVTHSHVTGNHGTHEFFLHIKFGEALQRPRDWLREAEAAVQCALALPRYQKAGKELG